MEQYIAIDNVCAWPNLTLMPDGVIIATIFNQPTHGRWEGDTECWTSEDDGRTWYRRGVPAPHDPGANRMNVAAGLAHDGSLIVIASGWSKRCPKGKPGSFGKTISNDFMSGDIKGAEELPPWVCRSTDGGRTWERSETVQSPPGKSKSNIPFGDIIRLNDGSLGFSSYGWDPPESKAYFYRSRDNGRTWSFQSIIQKDIDETALLALDNGQLLAAARTLGGDEHLELFISDDRGNTWTKRGPLTSGWQHPADLLKLADGRILLTYGIRYKGNVGFHGIGARISKDQGNSWSEPKILVKFEGPKEGFEGPTDGGYPSSIQTKEGIIVTAYYCNWLKFHQRYHMGVIRWRLEE